MRTGPLVEEQSLLRWLLCRVKDGKRIDGVKGTGNRKRRLWRCSNSLIYYGDGIVVGLNSLSAFSNGAFSQDRFGLLYADVQ